MFSDKKISIHFIGIGGIGMSAIAEILLDYGIKVSGSDVALNANIEKLKKRGVKVYIGHEPSNVKDANVVVHSSAIDKNNVELVHSKQINKPILNRAEILSDIMMLKKGLAIAGTHGKTTTTSMVSTILVENGFDPSYIIGGIVKNLQGHAKVGKGEFLAVEADESDGTFLEISPFLSIITNIDNDHLDFYGSEAELEKAFLKFANNVPFYGLSILNGDDDKLYSFKNKMKKPYLFYGTNPEKKGAFTYFAENLNQTNFGIEYDLITADKKKTKVVLSVNGKHNVQNSLAAIALCANLGIGIENVVNGIRKFTGVGRRLDKICDKKSVTVYDDYAHHPTEINASLEALRLMFPTKKIKLFFEPHRYTRTRDCWNQYLHCFNRADELFLMPIYPASEAPIAGITSDGLVTDINKLHPSFSKVIHNFSKELCETINLDDSSIVVVMGAGSVGKKAREALEAL